MKTRIVAIVLGLSLAGVAGAGMKEFGAPLHASKWQATTGKSLCTLKHSIPSYGEVTFIKGRSVPLATIIETNFNVTKGGKADLQALPPSWKTHADIEEMGKVDFRDGNIPFVIGIDLSQRMLDDLGEGMVISLAHMTSEENNDGWRVNMSPVNISKELEKFMQCGGSFELNRAGRKSAVHFATGKWNLTYSNLARLAAVTDLLKANPKYKRIVLDGYADNIGQNEPNMILSRHRGNAVKNFLVSMGISSGKIKVVGHGEVDEIDLNKTEALRARNRRTDISIIK